MRSKLFIYLPIIVLLGITVLSCEKNEIKSNPSDQISDEAYEIYSLVINEHCSSEKNVINNNFQRRKKVTTRNILQTEIPQLLKKLGKKY